MTTPTKGAQLDISISKHDLLLWLEAHGACEPAKDWIRGQRVHSLGELWDLCPDMWWLAWIVLHTDAVTLDECERAIDRAIDVKWKGVGSDQMDGAEEFRRHITADQVARAMVGELP